MPAGTESERVGTGTWRPQVTTAQKRVQQRRGCRVDGRADTPLLLAASLEHPTTMNQRTTQRTELLFLSPTPPSTLHPHARCIGTVHYTYRL